MILFLSVFASLVLLAGGTHFARFEGLDEYKEIAMLQASVDTHSIEIMSRAVSRICELYGTRPRGFRGWVQGVYQSWTGAEVTPLSTILELPLSSPSLDRGILSHWRSVVYAVDSLSHKGTERKNEAKETLLSNLSKGMENQWSTVPKDERRRIAVNLVLKRNLLSRVLSGEEEFAEDVLERTVRELVIIDCVLMDMKSKLVPLPTFTQRNRMSAFLQKFGVSLSGALEQPFRVKSLSDLMMMRLLLRFERSNANAQMTVLQSIEYIRGAMNAVELPYLSMYGYWVRDVVSDLRVLLSPYSEHLILPEEALKIILDALKPAIHDIPRASSHSTSAANELAWRSFTTFRDALKKKVEILRCVDVSTRRHKKISAESGTQEEVIEVAKVSNVPPLPLISRGYQGPPSECSRSSSEVSRFSSLCAYALLSCQGISERCLEVENSDVNRMLSVSSASVDQEIIISDTQASEQTFAQYQPSTVTFSSAEPSCPSSPPVRDHPELPLLEARLAAALWNNLLAFQENSLANPEHKIQSLSQFLPEEEAQLIRGRNGPEQEDSESPQISALLELPLVYAWMETAGKEYLSSLRSFFSEPLRVQRQYNPERVLQLPQLVLMSRVLAILNTVDQKPTE